MWQGQLRVEQVDEIEQGQHGSRRAGAVLRRLAHPSPGTEEVVAVVLAGAFEGLFDALGWDEAAAVPAWKAMASGGGCVSRLSSS